jgi:hypothetical protein
MAIAKDHRDIPETFAKVTRISGSCAIRTDWAPGGQLQAKNAGRIDHGSSNFS